jgi:DNA-binding response OmpR family regulator
MTKKILVAEDNKDILFILEMILKDAGYKVEPLPDGTSIVKGRKEWPDLFILDKDIPQIDGLAICKYLKQNEETRTIPIIMISCFHFLKNRAIEAGVDEFVEKPFELKHLLNIVDEYINPKQHRELSPVR